jgi:hypothetical protein
MGTKSNLNLAKSTIVTTSITIPIANLLNFNYRFVISRFGKLNTKKYWRILYAFYFLLLVYNFVFG